MSRILLRTLTGLKNFPGNSKDVWRVTKIRKVSTSSSPSPPQHETQVSDQAQLDHLKRSRNLQDWIAYQRTTFQNSAPTPSLSAAVVIKPEEEIPLESPAPQMEFPVAVDELNSLFSQCDSPDWPVGVSYDDFDAAVSTVAVTGTNGK